MTLFDQITNKTKLVGVVSWGEGKSAFCNLYKKSYTSRYPESLQVVGGLSMESIIQESMAKLRKFLTGYMNMLVYLVRLKKYQPPFYAHFKTNLAYTYLYLCANTQNKQ